MIGSEHVDEPVETTRNLVLVVRDIAREVGVLAVAFSNDAILVVLDVRRLEEERPLLFGEPPSPLELVERRGHPAPAVQALLGVPNVELDAEIAQGLLDARQLFRARHAVEHARDGRASERIVTLARRLEELGGVRAGP